MKILLMSNDPVGQDMSGLGIRNLSLASLLPEKISDSVVTLAVPNEVPITQTRFKAIRVRNNFDKFKLIWKNEVIITQGLGLIGLLFYFSRKKIVLDLYDPTNVEWLEAGRSKESRVYRAREKFNVDYINLQIKIANFSVCANPRQRDMLLGMFSSLGMIDTYTYGNDPSMEYVISLAPFGVRKDLISRPKKVLRGIVPGINEDDFILLWNGGVWNWYDPKTLIQAVYEICKERKNVKLFFLGTRHPNTKIKDYEVLNEAIDFAKELKILDKFVFFNKDWVGYEDSRSYLQEADLGVVCYSDNLETRFSNRTRILDLFWANLPIVSTRGDFFSNLVDARELGITVAEKNPKELKDAIERMIVDKEFYAKCKVNLKIIAQEYTWEKCWESVVRYLKNLDTWGKKRRGGLSYLVRLIMFYFRWASLRLLKFY